MSITQEQIRKIAKNLAKLNTTHEEKIFKDVNSILWYIDLLNEVDTTWVEATISVITKKDNILREDNIKPKNSREELLSCSKQKVIANQIAVDNIMK